MKDADTNVKAPKRKIPNPAKPRAKVTESAKVSVRDDFLASTVRQLRDMAGNVCSQPDCHVHTHGSKAKREGVFSIGVACHINAAAPGGPRYDPSQSREQRRHADNGIWMCQTHSRVVDADDSPYPVEILREWKRLAELRANAMVNKRAFSQAELSIAARKESVATLDQYINRTNNPIESPISQMIEGYEAGLTSLDPRFKVEVTKKGGVVHHSIEAVSDAHISLIISDVDNLAGFWEAEQALFEEGRELMIPSSNFKFAGSKLFEAIHQKSSGDGIGYLTLSGVKKTIKTNLYACDLQGHEHLIESFTSHYVSGGVRTVVDGSCLGGFLVLNAVINQEIGGCKLDLNYSIEAWRSRDILDLPLFSRLGKALPYLAQGHLVVEFEVGNDMARFDTSKGDGADAFLGQLYWIIDYLDKARQVAAKCAGVLYFNEIDLNEDLLMTLRRYCRLLTGPVEGARKPAKLATGAFTFFEGLDIESFHNDGRTAVVSVTPNKALEFRLFGQVIRAPRICSSYTGLEYLFYCDVKGRRTWVEMHTLNETLIEHTLVKDDSWEILS